VRKNNSWYRTDTTFVEYYTGVASEKVKSRTATTAAAAAARTSDRPRSGGYSGERYRDCRRSLQYNNNNNHYNIITIWRCLLTGNCGVRIRRHRRLVGIPT